MKNQNQHTKASGVRLPPTPQLAKIYQNRVLQAIADSGACTATSAQCAKAFQVTEQSVRRWACYDTAPCGIRPIKIGNRLRWRLDDIAKVLEGGL